MGKKIAAIVGIVTICICIGVAELVIAPIEIGFAAGEKWKQRKRRKIKNV